MNKKNINKEVISDKMIRFNLPELWIVIEAKDTKEAIEKAEKIISKNKIYGNH